MALIKEESAELRIEEVFSVKQEPEETTAPALLKQEKQELDVHGEEEEDLDEKHYGFTIGGKHFSYSETSVHVGQKEFVLYFTCQECRMSFSEKGSLKVHMRTHTGEKPYACALCGKSFSVKGNLKVHTRLHSGEKPYVCAHCGKAFIQKAGLDSHTRLHTGEKPYSCAHCGERFSHRATLTAHVRIHSAEKSFCCTFCDRSFRLKAQLKIHMQKHTREQECVSSVSQELR